MKRPDWSSKKRNIRWAFVLFEISNTSFSYFWSQFNRNLIMCFLKTVLSLFKPAFPFQHRFVLRDIWLCHMFKYHKYIIIRNTWLFYHQTLASLYTEDQLKTLINFCLHYIADLDIPIKRYVHLVTNHCHSLYCWSWCSY